MKHKWLNKIDRKHYYRWQFVTARLIIFVIIGNILHYFIRERRRLLWGQRKSVYETTFGVWIKNALKWWQWMNKFFSVFRIALGLINKYAAHTVFKIRIFPPPNFNNAMAVFTYTVLSISSVHLRSCFP